MRHFLWLLLLLPFSAFAQDVGAVDVVCDAPTEYTDGTPIDQPLTFNFYWGKETGNYPNALTGLSACEATLVLEPGVWRIVSTASCVDCIESELTEEVTLIVTGKRRPRAPRNLSAEQRRP